MYMYDVYPLKFGFERGSGTENHEFYYFIRIQSVSITHTIFGYFIMF